MSPRRHRQPLLPPEQHLLRRKQNTSWHPIFQCFRRCPRVALRPQVDCSRVPVPAVRRELSERCQPIATRLTRIRSSRRGVPQDRRASPPAVPQQLVLQSAGRRKRAAPASRSSHRASPLPPPTSRSGRLRWPLRLARPQCSRSESETRPADTGVLCR